MSRRDFLARIAKDTVNIVKEGQYTKGNKIISIKDDVKFSVENTNLYTPEDGDKLLLELKPSRDYQTEFEVTNETTLKAIRRLLSEGFENVAALNFASAKNPGGGFLKGSSAQEESLTRTSALYESISKKREMYDYNKKIKSGLYSDYMIYSPFVPVFKDDMGNLLDEPYKCNFITSPAVNVGILKSEEKRKIRSVMKTRVEKILAVALENNNNVIVLGAFGCGVFKNRPVDIAQIFKQVLNSEQFKGQFKKVTFAIYDKTPNKMTFNIFKNTFGTKK